MFEYICHYKVIMFEYICHYKPIGDGPNTVMGIGLADFRDGFWLDREYKLTKNSDNVFWISPSSIHYIEKIRIS